MSLWTFTADNPLRPVDWRWERARALRGMQRPPSRRGEDDEWVSRLVAYQTEREAARDNVAIYQAYRRFPALFRAEELKTTSDVYLRNHLEARLLTRASLEEVAGTLKLDLEIVKWYEASFFNVLDRIDDTVWIAGKVIGPSLVDGFNDRDSGPLLKWFAYGGGAKAVDALLSLGEIPPLKSAEDVRSIVNDRICTHLERRALTAMSSLRCNDAFSKIQLGELYLKYRDLMDRIGSAGSADEMTTNIAAVVRALAWGVGADGRGSERIPKVGPAMHRVDRSAAKPRAGELVLLHTGGDVSALDEAAEVHFPEQQRAEVSS